MSTRISSLHSFDTEYSADSIEFVPFPNSAHSRFFACGTYQLAKDDESGSHEQEDRPRMRLGRIILCEVVEAGETVRMVERQTIESKAILDMKWSHQNIAGKEILAVVDSIGNISSYSLEDGSSNNSFLNPLATFATTSSSSVLALSLDWSNRLDTNGAPRIVTSHSSGEISLISLSNLEMTVEEQWVAHEFEAWIAAFDYWDTRKLYSGGDDCKFKAWDMRIGTSAAIFTSKRHTMGVTAIQSSPHNPHLLATGSYDEHVLLWDTRSLSRPLADISTGGGVWRLKWHPVRKDTLLAACMHGGAFVIDVAKDVNENLSCALTSSFLEHQSMVYGADWCYQLGDSGGELIVTCSFYDHIAHAWRPWSLLKE